MKAEITNSKRPELAAGQLWKYLDSGRLYLAIELGDGKYLIPTEHFHGSWALSEGFGSSAEAFEYVGNLKVTP